jgi:ABC-type sugar transport system permease subunit
VIAVSLRSRHKMHAPARNRGVRRSRAEILFVVPVLVLVGSLMIVPGLFSIAMSVFDWTPGLKMEYTGLDNFAKLLASERFHAILGNQAVLLLGVPLWTVLPLGVAVLLQGMRFAGVARTIVFFPAILSTAIVGILFRAVLAPEGLVNEVLHGVGLGALAQPWIDDAVLVKPTLILVMAWAGLGLGVIVFSAALSSVRQELLEAAILDGATWIQRLRHVMLPSIRSTVVFWVSLQIVGLFLWTFGWIFALTLGGPGIASTTIDYDVYNNAMRFGFFGLAAAESVLLVGVVLLILAASRLVLRRLGSGEEG